MKKNKDIRRLLGLASFTIFAFVVTSCVNDNYDLDKEIDGQVSFGGNVTLPVGSTSQISLLDMLSSADIEMLETIDGKYSIAMRDSMTIEIDKIGGDEGLIITVDPVNKDIETEFEKPELSPFDFNVDDSTIPVATDNMDVIDTSDGATMLDPTTSLDAKLPLVAGEYANCLEIEFDETSSSTSITIEGMECSDQVQSVEDIKFKNTPNGAEAEIVLNVSEIKSLFEDDGKFSLVIPMLKVEFPEGFILDSGSNIVTFDDLETETESLTAVFYIQKYEKTLNCIEGKLEDIGGDVIFSFNSMQFSGTAVSTASLESTAKISFTVNSNIEIEEMSINVDNIEVPIDDDDISEIVVIDGIPTMIKSIDYVNIDASTNDMVIEITPATIAGLSVKDEAYISIVFPKSKFILASNPDIDAASSEEYYILKIKLDDVVNGQGVRTIVKIESLILSNETLYEVEVEGETEKQIDFDPEIKLFGTTFSMSGTMTLTEFNQFVEQQQTSPQEIVTSVETETWVISSADIVTDAYVSTLEKEEEPIDIEVEASEELVRVDSLLFKNGKVKVTLDVVVDIEGIDSDMSFSNYTISFPSFIVFEEEAGLNSDNQLILNDVFVNETGKRTFTKDLYIEKLDFTDTAYANIIVGDKIVINESIILEGDLVLEGGDANSAELSDNIIGVVNVVIEDMVVSEFYGIVSPDFSMEKTEIDLSDLSDVFAGEISATLTNPTITIEAKNTIAAPVEIKKIALQPYKSGAELTSISTTSSVIVDAATLDGDEVITKIVITGNDVSEDVVDGVKYVKMDNLKNILDGMPDNLVLDIEAEMYAATGENHMVDVNKDYTFDFDYEVNVPLEFDELDVEYVTTTNGFNESFGEVLSNVVGVELQLEIEAVNTLPISLEIAAIEPVDIDGNVISGLADMVVDGSDVIVASSTSTIIFSIADNEYNALSELDGFKITIKASATSTEGGAALEETQYLQLGIKLNIIGDITFDIDFGNEDDDEQE